MKAAVIRNAGLADIGLMLDWAAGEGWNPGLGDAAPFHAADPEGFFIAELDGGPVAAISVVNHSDRMAFLGFYICRPEFRGQGHGSALWKLGLAHAGMRTVGLDGVAAQEASYARHGFVRAGASRRFRGAHAGLATLEAGHSGARPFEAEDLGWLSALDTEANGYARPAFLAGWMSPAPGRRTVVAADRRGYATARRCREGVKIGPVVAGTVGEGLALAAAAGEALTEGPVFIDAAPGSPLAEALPARGFVETFATARMYRGPAPNQGANLLAIGSMELG